MIIKYFKHALHVVTEGHKAPHEENAVIFYEGRNNKDWL
jgi:hypothetical protein